MDNKAFTKFKDGWIMGTNAMFIPKMFCTNFMFTLGSQIKALDRPWIYVALKNRHTKLRMHSTIRRNERHQKGLNCPTIRFIVVLLLMVVIYITFFYTIQHYLFPNKIFEKPSFSEYRNFTQKQKVLRMVEKSSLPILGKKNSRVCVDEKDHFFLSW